MQGRLFIGIAGIPGSGKSTLARKLLDKIGTEQAVVIPMDGFHFSKAELLKFDNPTAALKRRGAEFTFNPQSMLDLIFRIKQQGDEIILAPSFDHAVGDPILDDISILPSHKYIIFEGLYLHLNKPVWKEIHDQFDQTWFLSVPEKTCFERLIERHLHSGLVSNRNDAVERVQENDLPNGRFLVENSLPAMKVISIDDLMDSDKIFRELIDL